MTEKQAQKILDKWQRRLRLQDWDIELICFKAETINSDGELANCHRHRYTHAAKIMVALQAETVEENIVHELLHLAFTDIWRLYCDCTEALGCVAKEIMYKQFGQREEQLVEKLLNCLTELTTGGSQ